MAAAEKESEAAVHGPDYCCQAAADRPATDAHVWKYEHEPAGEHLGNAQVENLRHEPYNVTDKEHIKQQGRTGNPGVRFCSAFANARQRVTAQHIKIMRAKNSTKRSERTCRASNPIILYNKKGYVRSPAIPANAGAKLLKILKSSRPLRGTAWRP